MKTYKKQVMTGLQVQRYGTWGPWGPPGPPSSTAAPGGEAEAAEAEEKEAEPEARSGRRQQAHRLVMVGVELPGGAPKREKLVDISYLTVG